MMVPRWASIIGLAFIALGAALLRLDVYWRRRPRPATGAGLSDWRLDRLRPFALIAVGTFILLVALIAGS